MKGDDRRRILDHLAAILLAGMPAKVAEVRALYPSESLPDIKTVYLNEEDYGKIKLFPCLVVLSSGPTVLTPMSEAYTWEYPVDIIALDTPTADGIPACRNRLYAYQGCSTELLLSDYGYVAGYWTGIRPLEPVDPQSVIAERFGGLGLLEGFRFGIQTTLSY
jgi:hypothetical protein